MNGGALIKKHSTMIPRAPGKVYAGLQRGSAKCLNTSQSQNFSRMTPYGVQTTNITHYYQGSFRQTSGRGELTIAKQTKGAIVPGAPNGRYIAYLVDAVPVSGGTRLDIYGGRIGYGDLNKAVEAWARGASSGCPALP